VLPSHPDTAEPASDPSHARRAEHRLHQRWAHPHDERRGPAGVIAIACARELAAFCWEAVTLTDTTPNHRARDVAGARTSNRKAQHCR